ncbi:hypothetical protein HMN09_00648100 [Mycena chlorophos]|uniref:Deoxycytidylate deaminase n=1 Tax=Mycena chlorophos TaxID=658473 RepID=A0A8H6T4V8_MYCCL|nr:hypothetical protein HMN09_00648100 [Mycena chlorophos]
MDLSGAGTATPIAARRVKSQVGKVTCMAMAARVHNQASNRAKPHDALERRDVFKTVLDSPLRVPWPSIPMSIQNQAFALARDFLEPVVKFKSEQRGKKRPIHDTNDNSSNKKRKLDKSGTGAAVNNPASDTSSDRPPLLDHMVIGINEVTRRVESQIQSMRRAVAVPAAVEASPVLAPLSLILVCRADIDPQILIDHFPHELATINSAKPAHLVKMIYLPAGAEAELAKLLKLRRVSVVAFDVDAPGLEKFHEVMQAVDVVTAPWLTAPFDASHPVPVQHQLISTHVKQTRTTAPKDMKLAKLIRAEGKIAAKKIKQGKAKARKEKQTVSTYRTAGSRCAGKSAVEDYLIAKDFQRVSIRPDIEQLSDTSSDVLSNFDDAYEDQVAAKHLSFLSMGPSPIVSTKKPQHFASAAQLLDHVTREWRRDWVTSDLTTREALEMFTLRPFVLVLSVDAPLLERFHRFNTSNSHPVSLEAFVREDDLRVFGDGPRESTSSLNALRDLVNIHISNSFQSLSALHGYLDDLNLLDPGHVRPPWDAYFMTLASLASRRSNCMKRRVGAVLVRENRILATGQVLSWIPSRDLINMHFRYNGTPRGLTNCNEGGCIRCNTNAYPGDAEYSECLCLHAEENALLEAGRERVGLGSVLYCNTCPCLTCTIKIIQTGVKTVVYNLSYKVDEASARLFAEAGVELRRFQPIKTV